MTPTPAANLVLTKKTGLAVCLALRALTAVHAQSPASIRIDMGPIQAKFHPRTGRVFIHAGYTVEQFETLASMEAAYTGASEK